MKLFSVHGQKVSPKISISLQRKEFLKWNKKQFSSILMGFHWRKENSIFARSEPGFMLVVIWENTKGLCRILFINKVAGPEATTGGVL